MHVTILKDNLTKALLVVSKSISPKPQLPILAYIILKTENNQLKIIGSNLELGIEYTTGARIEKEGEVAVAGKLLIEFINSITTEKIELVTEGNNLLINAGKIKAKFTTTNPADFPPFPQIGSKKINLPLNKIKDAITRSVFAASTDESKPVLTGIRTSLSSGKLSFIATDGYRLSIESVEVENKKEELLALLPARSLLEMVRIALEVKADEVSLSIIENKNQVVFILPNTVIYSRLIDGEYPNVEKIIPAGFKTRVVVEVEELLKSVKTAALFARGAANIIKVKIEKAGLRLSANSPQVGDDEDFVEAKVDGEEMEIAFNYRFLIDILSNFPGSEVAFETAGALNPGVFKPVSGSLPAGGSFLHIIMPVRVQG